MSETLTPVGMVGFDVHWRSPMGDSGVVFSNAASAERAVYEVQRIFDDAKFPGLTTEAVDSIHTADRHTWLLIGYGVWGHGETLDEAKKNLKAEGWSLRDGYIQVEFPVGLTFRGVTGMGGYRYEAIGLDGNDVEPVERIVPGRKFKK
jgi:hypothetical protein